jgi:O-antigen/teichoic acid export membrane protein
MRFVANTRLDSSPREWLRITKNTLVLIIAGGVMQLSNFLVSVLAAREFGVTAFGQISFAIALTSYFLVLADAGVAPLAIREVARNRLATSDYAGRIILISLCLAAASFALSLLVAGLFFQPPKSWLIILYGLQALGLALNLSWVFRAHERMELVALTQIVNGVLYALVALALIRWGLGLVALPLANLVGIGGAVLLAGVAFLRLFDGLRLQIDFGFAKNFLWACLPLGLSTLMVSVYFRFDTVLLSLLKGDTEVGYYNAAYRIIWLIVGLQWAFYAAIYPALARKWPDRAAFEQLANRLLKLMLPVAIPMAVGGVILARPLLDLFFGPAYAPGARAFQILICGTAVNFVSGIWGYELIASDRQSQYMRMEIAVAVTNLALNAILIPLFSLYGAAIATLIAQVVGACIAYRALRRIFHIALFDYMLAAVISALLMGGLLFGLRAWPVLALVPLGVLTYMCLFAVGSMIGRMFGRRYLPSKL